MKELEKKFESIKKEASAPQEFKNALWLKLSSKIETRAPIPAIQLWRFALVGIVSIVIVFGIGTGVYAYESPRVIEGHPLYFIKNNLERVQERTAITSAMRERLKKRMIERRLREERYKTQRSRVNRNGRE